MSGIVLVTGGARSGKSALAERLTLRVGAPACYIATAEAGDDEMAARIAEHQARRGDEWVTEAEPLDLIGALDRTDTMPRLVDCLTLWVSNLIFAERDLSAETRLLVEALERQAHPVVLQIPRLAAYSGCLVHPRWTNKL